MAIAMILYLLAEEVELGQAKAGAETGWTWRPEVGKGVGG